MSMHVAESIVKVNDISATWPASIEYKNYVV